MENPGGSFSDFVGVIGGGSWNHPHEQFSRLRAWLCEFFVRRFGPPGVRFTLRHDNNRGKARAVFADRGSNAELSLDPTIGTTGRISAACKNDPSGVSHTGMW
jgi:hypothetical protein